MLFYRIEKHTVGVEGRVCMAPKDKLLLGLNLGRITLINRYSNRQVGRVDSVLLP